MSVSGRLGLIALIALTVFVSTVQPIARPSGRLYPRFGLIRMSLLSESPDNDDTPLRLPVVADARVAEPPLIVAALLLLLKARRMAFVPISVRRLKLPSRTTSWSPPSGDSSHAAE